MVFEVININDTDISPNEYIYIGRPSKYSNPYSSKPSKYLTTKKVKNRKESLEKFERYINKHPELIDQLWEEVKAKRIFKLGCFCSPKYCHGDILVDRLKQKKYLDIFKDL